MIMKNKMNTIIKLMQKPYNYVPKIICNLLWDIFNISELKIAILYRNLFVGKFVSIKNIQNLSIGNDVSIHAYTYIDAFGQIKIGNDVSIANHSTLISSDHIWTDDKIPIKFNQVEPKKIVIENDVWIASGVRVLGGITINKRNVIGAGAVVNKNTENNCVYVGVPIKKVKEI